MVDSVLGSLLERKLSVDDARDGRLGRNRSGDFRDPVDLKVEPDSKV